MNYLRACRNITAWYAGRFVSAVRGAVKITEPTLRRLTDGKVELIDYETYKMP